MQVELHLPPELEDAVLEFRQFVYTYYEQEHDQHIRKIEHLQQVYGAIFALAQRYEYARDELEQLRKAKKERDGGFAKNIIFTKSTGLHRWT